ncbi:ROK family protein [Mycolicibacterium sp. CH28]|uniref:ROK family protein n=1 Tax=Mycolicibacterium sp. CH28 TaxID=2512237 RepID=UPI00107FE710|nr:ROK family protein [Mycolicibacterium sp. CH28]TGD83821.1 ROK family protein [Mycolicibacterium sp. CH28]
MPAPVIVAFDFGGTKTAVAVCELDGAQLDSAAVPVSRHAGAQPNLQAAITQAHAMLARTAPARPIAAVGACTFGIPMSTEIRLATAIDGWSDLALESELRDAFPDAPVSVSNDVKAAATAELAFGRLTGCDPGIYLNLGTGLAAAIVIGGVVLNGYHGASGEIGYNLRSREALGHAADRVILEDFVSGGALSRRGESIFGRPVSAAEVLSDVTTDPRISDLVNDFVGELAFHVVNLTNAIDPQRIVFGGGMTAAWWLLHPALRAALDAAVPYPPELVRAAFPDTAPLIGAIALGSRAAQSSHSH